MLGPGGFIAELKIAITEETTCDLVTHKSPRSFYRPELDAMRFFAFLCVFLNHTLHRSTLAAGPPPSTVRGVLTDSLKFAVSLFFLLSGYLITTLLSMEKASTGDVHLGAFYIRRIARIWPLYYSFFFIVLLAGTVVPRILPSLQAIAAFAFFSGNWFIAFGGAIPLSLGILWSVNVEEQFYAAWPLFTKYCGPRGLIAASAGIIAGAYAVLFWLGIHGEFSEATLRFSTLVEMQFFAAGALLATVLPRDGVRMPGTVRLLLGLFGITCWAAGTYFSGDPIRLFTPTWWTPSASYLCILLGCLALFLGFSGTPGKWFPQPVLWLGKISYGLYVYHGLVLTFMSRWLVQTGHHPIVSAIRICLDLLVTILTAGLSYHWLERPFLRWKQNFTFIPNRSA